MKRRTLSSKSCRAFVALATSLLLIACSTPSHVPVDAHSTPSNTNAVLESSPAGTLALKAIADIPLTDGTTRLDYQITAPTDK